MKIIITPLTHWDREWYFTNQTSDTLLKFNLDNCFNFNYQINKFYLDGQMSLVEDYLKYASKENVDNFKNNVDENKVILNSLYSQPDVFNSLGETTIRNIKIAKKLAKQYQLKLSNIFYCPDTFGFGFNIPQILNLLGFENFVFWRGLSHQYKDNDYLEWHGNNFKVDAYRFKYGYWVLGALFPWRGLNQNNLKQKAKEFLDQFNSSDIYKHFKQQAINQNDKIILPFGGDQAPVHYLTNDFFKAVNELSDDEWVIGSFEEFFENNIPNKKVYQTIDYGYESKIHRTISSTRYDFKKLFRENEINLYHQLEPLQIFYKNSDEKYCVNNDDLIKSICLMQAHDVLGGCVSDKTYVDSYQKLKGNLEYIESKKHLLLKQISTQLDLNKDNLLIFNPNVNNKSDNISYYSLFTENKLSGSITNDKFELYVLNSNKSLEVDNTYKSNILFINKSLTPFDIRVINLNELKPFRIIEKEFKEFNEYTNFKVQYDNGDLFDCDPIDERFPNVKIDVLKSKQYLLNNNKIISIKGNLIIDQVVSNFKILVTKLNNNDKYININIDNKNKDIVVKWVVNQEFNNPKYLQQLGITDYQFDEIKNWKELGYKENPINVQKNTGLIFDNKNYICTKGNNEFSFDQNKITITLFRSIGVLGKANLINRPGQISGLANHLIETPLAQLNKQLEFNFKIGSNNNDVDQKLNSFYKTPILFHQNSNNLMYSKMEKFVFLKQPFEIKNFSLQIQDGFVSSTTLNENNKLELLVSNFKDESINVLDNQIDKNKIGIINL